MARICCLLVFVVVIFSTLGKDMDGPEEENLFNEKKQEIVDESLRKIVEILKDSKLKSIALMARCDRNPKTMKEVVLNLYDTEKSKPVISDFNNNKIETMSPVEFAKLGENSLRKFTQTLEKNIASRFLFALKYLYGNDDNPLCDDSKKYLYEHVQKALQKMDFNLTRNSTVKEENDEQFDAFESIILAIVEDIYRLNFLRDEESLSILQNVLPTIEGFAYNPSQEIDPQELYEKLIQLSRKDLKKLVLKLTENAPIDTKSSVIDMLNYLDEPMKPKQLIKIILNSILPTEDDFSLSTKDFEKIALREIDTYPDKTKTLIASYLMLVEGLERNQDEAKQRFANTISTLTEKIAPNEKKILTRYLDNWLNGCTGKDAKKAVLRILNNED